MALTSTKKNTLLIVILFYTTTEICMISTLLNLMALRMFWEYMKMSYKTPSLCFSLTNKFTWDAIANNNMITSRYDVPIQYYVSHHSAKEPLIYPYKEDNKEIHIWQTRGIEME